MQGGTQRADVAVCINATSNTAQHTISTTVHGNGAQTVAQKAGAEESREEVGRVPQLLVQMCKEKMEVRVVKQKGQEESYKGEEKQDSESQVLDLGNTVMVREWRAMRKQQLDKSDAEWEKLGEVFDDRTTKQEEQAKLRTMDQMLASSSFRQLTQFVTMEILQLEERLKKAIGKRKEYVEKKAGKTRQREEPAEREKESSGLKEEGRQEGDKSEECVSDERSKGSMANREDSRGSRQRRAEAEQSVERKAVGEWSEEKEQLLLTYLREAIKVRLDMEERWLECMFGQRCQRYKDDYKKMVQMRTTIAWEKVKRMDVEELAEMQIAEMKERMSDPKQGFFASYFVMRQLQEEKEVEARTLTQQLANTLQSKDELMDMSEEAMKGKQTLKDRMKQRQIVKKLSEFDQNKVMLMERLERVLAPEEKKSKKQKKKKKRKAKGRSDEQSENLSGDRVGEKASESVQPLNEAEEKEEREEKDEAKKEEKESDKENVQNQQEIGGGHDRHDHNISKSGVLLSCRQQNERVEDAGEKEKQRRKEEGMGVKSEEEESDSENENMPYQRGRAIDGRQENRAMQQDGSSVASHPERIAASWQQGERVDRVDEEAGNWTVVGAAADKHKRSMGQQRNARIAGDPVSASSSSSSSRLHFSSRSFTQPTPRINPSSSASLPRGSRPQRQCSPHASPREPQKAKEKRTDRKVKQDYEARKDEEEIARGNENMLNTESDHVRQKAMRQDSKSDRTTQAGGSGRGKQQKEKVGKADRVGDDAGDRTVRADRRMRSVGKQRNAPLPTKPPLTTQPAVPSSPSHHRAASPRGRSPAHAASVRGRPSKDSSRHVVPPPLPCSSLAPPPNGNTAAVRGSSHSQPHTGHPPSHARAGHAHSGKTEEEDARKRVYGVSSEEKLKVTHQQNKAEDRENRRAGQEGRAQAAVKEQGHGSEMSSCADVDDHMCVVCMDARKRTVFLPCWHQVCCVSCAKEVSECPMCRATIEDRKNPFG